MYDSLLRKIGTSCACSFIRTAGSAGFADAMGVGGDEDVVVVGVAALTGVVMVVVVDFIASGAGDIVELVIVIDQ